MKTSINLALGHKVVKKKPYTVYVYGLFAVILACALVIMAVNVGLKIQHSTLTTQGQELSTAINAQAEKKINLLIVSERTRNIASLFSSRGTLDTRLEELVNIFPSSVSVTGLNVQEEEFVLIVEASNLSAMNSVLEEDLPTYLKETKSGIQMVHINSFQAQEGNYELSLRFKYPGGIINE